MDTHTHIHTHRTTTVTLAAHARRGLIRSAMLDMDNYFRLLLVVALYLWRKKTTEVREVSEFALFSPSTRL